MADVGVGRALTQGFTAEVDTVDARQWSAILGHFGDANIFQTWAYGAARSGVANLSHLVLKKGEHVVAAIQARLAGFSRFRLGAAYVRWGPLCKAGSGGTDQEIFRQAARAIRNEYALRRGMVIRLLPPLFSGDETPWTHILTSEGFELKHANTPSRTIIMDLRPSLNELEAGLHQKWRKHLRQARKNNLQIIIGQDDALFDALGSIYQEMLGRKRFADPADIGLYRKTQQGLSGPQKMTVVLCENSGEPLAGALFSGLGETGLDLFRATSNRGVTSYGSYLVQWKVVEYLKEHGCREYNLNGINPSRNPGGYQFKSQMAGKNGREVSFVGVFDAYPHAAMRLLATIGERVRREWKRRSQPSAKTINQ